MKVQDILYECETIYLDEDGNVLTEAATRAFKRVGKKVERRFRCTAGPKKGKVVSDPILCSKRKDPKRVRTGRKVARSKQGVRIRKSEISKRTSLSRMVTKMNRRLKGFTPSSK